MSKWQSPIAPQWDAMWQTPLDMKDAQIQVIKEGRDRSVGTNCWIPHNASFGFLDMPRPTLGQIHFLDRL
jgi:hypothetical protein